MVGATTRSKVRAALLRAGLILAAAAAVAPQRAWRIQSPTAPVPETMSIAALLNFAANGYCLYRLTPLRTGDINMALRVSRNDVIEGFAVLAAAVPTG